MMFALFCYFCCFRSFWIRGRWSLGYDRYAVRVGLGSDPRENELLRTQGISKSKMNMAIIRLSTSSNNSGEWQFASGNVRANFRHFSKVCFPLLLHSSR